jgi:hypothetical protein
MDKRVRRRESSTANIGKRSMYCMEGVKKNGVKVHSVIFRDLLMQLLTRID